MTKFLLRFYLWGSLGFTTEIIFTAFHEMVSRYHQSLHMDFRLEGNTYLWMFFIYGLGAILFPLVYKYIEPFQLIIRLLLMAAGIFAIEFISGALLQLTTGHCPWEYHSRWSIMGFIRLDYLPAWMLFGFVLEQAHRIFERMLTSYDAPSIT